MFHGVGPRNKLIYDLLSGSFAGEYYLKCTGLVDRRGILDRLGESVKELAFTIKCAIALGIWV